MNKVRASSHKYPHVEKNKNLREQNFKGVANNKQLDSEDTQRSHFSSYIVSKLNSCVKYPDSFICFHCAEEAHIATLSLRRSF